MEDDAAPAARRPQPVGCEIRVRRAQCADLLSLPGGLLLLSPPLDAAGVADPDSHSLLILGPLDALAGFQASFSDALRGELHRLAALRAGERGCRFRHAARIARLSRSTDGSAEPSLWSPDPRRVSRELRRVPAGARHG